MISLFLKGRDGVKKRNGTFCRDLMGCHCLITVQGGQVPGSAVGTHLVLSVGGCAGGFIVAATALAAIGGCLPVDHGGLNLVWAS